MKRFLFLVALLPLFIQAQTIQKGASALVYSLPKTELIIHIESEVITEKPGQFYQYSERYLAASDVITSEKNYHRLLSIRVETVQTPDNNRRYTIYPKKNAIENNISVNDDGLLCGINVEPIQLPKKSMYATVKADIDRAERDLLPLSEEYMMAGSVAKMAEGAAKEIFRLRENRIDILAGDVEYVPTDGESLQTMLAEIDAQEQQLTELFTGTVSKTKKLQTLRYTPDKNSRDKVLFRFSSYLGVVGADELSGEPYYLNISYEPVKEQIDPKAKSKKDVVQVFTLIPVTAEVRIDNGKKEFFKESIILPQLGVLTPIPFETINRYSRVYVSPETGRLLSIEQNRK